MDSLFQSTRFCAFLPVLVLQLANLTGLVQDLFLQLVGGQGMFQELELESRRLVQHLRATQQTRAGRRPRGTRGPCRGPALERAHPGPRAFLGSEVGCLVTSGVWEALLPGLYWASFPGPDSGVCVT